MIYIFIFSPIPVMGQHFTLGAGPTQIMGQYVLPRLYGCRRLWLLLPPKHEKCRFLKRIWPHSNSRSSILVSMESPYVTYGYLLPFWRYSRLKIENCWFYPPLPCLTPTSGGTPWDTCSKVIYIHRWKVHLMGYNSVADIMGLSSFFSHSCLPKSRNHAKIR